MDVRETLEQFQKREKELRALTNAYEKAKIWAEASTPRYSDIAVSGSSERASDRTGDGAVRLEEICNELNKSLCGISEELAIATHLIELVDDPLDRAILSWHYISGFSWAIVANQVFMSKANVRKRAKKAIESIERKMSTFEHP